MFCGSVYHVTPFFSGSLFPLQISCHFSSGFYNVLDSAVPRLLFTPSRMSRKTGLEMLKVRIWVIRHLINIVLTMFGDMFSTGVISFYIWEIFVGKNIFVSEGRRRCGTTARVKARVRCQYARKQNFFFLRQPRYPLRLSLANVPWIIDTRHVLPTSWILTLPSHLMNDLEKK